MTAKKAHTDTMILLVVPLGFCTGTELLKTRPHSSQMAFPMVKEGPPASEEGTEHPQKRGKGETKERERVTDREREREREREKERQSQRERERVKELHKKRKGHAGKNS